MFSDQSGIKLEINNRRIAGKSLNILKLSNTLLNNNKVKEEIKKIRKYFKLNKNENSISNLL